ncbi:hypothetical protein [Brevibacterium aurantiacum]|nr:hypothetical protein [Brevibacterium aurantiacum]
MTADTKSDGAAQQAHVWPPVLAIDPGSRETGVCLRVGTEALEAVTVEQEDQTGEHTETVKYAMEVVEAAKEITRRNRDLLNEEAATRGLAPGGLRHAVETLVAPTGRPAKGRRTAVGPRVLASLPTASTVLGAVVGTWPRTILVAPHGEAGWDAVGREAAPTVLRGRTPAGWLKGGSDRSHQRAAWAVAGAAHTSVMASLRQQATTVTTAALPLSPSTKPDVLVAILRQTIQETGSWDLLGRLPTLAQSVVATSTRDQTAGANAATAVAEYLDSVEVEKP